MDYLSVSRAGLCPSAGSDLSSKARGVSVAPEGVGFYE